MSTAIMLKTDNPELIRRINELRILDRPVEIMGFQFKIQESSCMKTEGREILHVNLNALEIIT